MSDSYFARHGGRPVKNHDPAIVVFLKKELPDDQEAATRLNAPIDLKPRHSTPGRSTVV